MTFNKIIKLNYKKIQKGRCFVVSEISANHSGNFSKLKLLIDKLSKAGVDAIKIQAYEAKTITIESSRKDFKISNKNAWAKYKTLYELYKKAETPFSWYKKIFDAIRKKCKRKKKWTQEEVNEMINDVEYVTDLEYKPEGPHDYSDSSDELMTDKGKLDTGYSSPEQKGCMARCLGRKKGKPLRQKLDAMDWQSRNEGKRELVGYKC